jgi:F0F1-type ATP synthase assembly protein I
VRNAGDHPNIRHDKSHFLRRAGLYLGIAFELTGTILGGPVIGYFLDSYFGTSPWFLIAVTAIAFAGAFVRLVQWARVFARERDASGSEKNDTAN